MNRDESVVSDLSCLVTAVLFLLGLVVLAVRLSEVQVDDAANYSYANARQSVRRIQTDGRRGRVLDRHGEVLAANRQAVSIVCDVARFQKRSWEATAEAVEKAISEVSQVVERPSLLTPKAIRRHISQTLAMPLTVWGDIDERSLARFCEHEWRFPGFFCRETDVRVYPAGSVAAHVIGYVGRDRGESEAGDEKFNFYYPEMRGRSGLEIYYDSFLHGVPGERRVLVDARGFAIRDWVVVESTRGPDLLLALDMKIQRAVERQLVGERGACAVINPQNGDVLALASAPGFDPNTFVPSLKPDLYERLAKDPAKPLLNRASGGSYAPGSTFKPITALAGLEAGISPQMEYECEGVYVCGTMHLHCARRWGHGLLDMQHALRESCNPYFCNLGAQVGTNALIRAARAMGLGARTGLDLGVDIAGIVPDGEWKARVYHEMWYPGDLPQMSIGQGMLLVSPLQMACVAGAIATGYLVTPHLKADIPTERNRVPYTKSQLDVVREGMRMVVDGGGGRRAGENVAVRVAGKTGTAEVGVGASRRKNTWFIAYAPLEQPTVAIAMVIENGDTGGGTTAPKVGAILKSIFGERRSDG